MNVEVLGPTIVWFAAGGGFVRRGPFTSQMKAWEAMVLIDREQERQRCKHPVDTRVWPEEV